MTIRNETGLTEAQTLLWTAEQMNPGAPIYTQAFAYVIETELDEDLFEEAFQHLVSQTDALRAVVRDGGGLPTQGVLEQVDFNLPILDFSTQENPLEAFKSWARRRVTRTMDISERMFDSALARLGDGKTGWYLSQHHLMTDAWSFALLFRQFESLYLALRDGKELPDPLPAFMDYVEHEHGARASDAPSDTGEHKPRRAIGLYGAAPSRVGSANHRLAIELGADRSKSLRELAGQPGVRALTTDLGMFRLFATALMAFLSRISGDREITIGAPSHNRATEAFRNTVGLFTEVYPLSVELTPDETFASLFQKVVAASDAYLRSSRPGGSRAAVNRQTNAVLNYITAGFGSFDDALVSSEWLHPGHVEPEHHLRVHVTDFDLDGDIELLLDCNESVLGLDERRVVPAHFLSILDAMLDELDQPIAGIDLLTPEEADRLDAINETERGGHADTVVDLFEETVAAYPDSAAIVSGDKTLTFAELDELTRRGAARIPAGSVVGICMPRSSEAVVAMLSVLRAGSAYVPIDPTWPDRRLDFVLEDSGCALVVGGSRASTDSISFDQLMATGEGVTRTVAADDLAYIMYTSGSTGTPKGVMIDHGALSNYATWARDYYDRGRRLSFPLFSPLTFDLTITSIFVPLISGGKIVVYPERAEDVDLSVQEVFENDDVDIVKLTPSHLSLLTEKDLSSSSRIRQLILGGEELTTSAASSMSSRLDGAAIHNEYGPTEATVGCIVHTFDPERDRGLTVPIGRPIANMRAHVLDSNLNRVPLGVPGDLWLGGAGIAVGYANRPELTARNFLADSEIDPGRIYATGDRARIRPDGIIEYLGRQDDQVKVRGVRIELGEIEAALASHPDVTAAAATVQHRPELPARDELFHCARCGLPSNYPGASFDEDDVCNQCREYEEYADRADVYFEPLSELEQLFERARSISESQYDCVSLLSGGKDSTYALCRLVDMGVRPLAFTLDNGYISDEAKANIRRVCDTLGVDHVFGTTPSMNEIFVDSLQRHSNVCNGCFKTIYTLSMQLARERGIPLIVTGLSRGQFFETRLTADLFTDGPVTSKEIDDKVLEARKAYHQVDDAPRRLLDVRIFDNDSVFEDLEFVDFYRYCDVSLDEMLTYLNSKVPWIRPRDTGRSTNCLINDVGIFVHQKERGYHNYALPYSWDVRLGVKTRDEAIEELDDDIDISRVRQILHEIGYPEEVTALESDSRLVAYYTGASSPTPSQVRKHVAEILPSSMMPSQFVQLDSIPLTPNGKVDREALPEPGSARPELETPLVAPQTHQERMLVELWKGVLGIDNVGVLDNFFDLGGDSIMAIQIVARARRLGLDVSLHQLFETLTIRELAATAGSASSSGPEAISGDLRLTPAQRWFFDELEGLTHFHHVVRVDPGDDLDLEVLERCLPTLAETHAALRQRFLPGSEHWGSEVVEEAAAPEVRILDATGLSADERLELERGAMEGFELDQPPLMRLLAVRNGRSVERLVFIAHHLIVDLVSWSVILDDLDLLYSMAASGETITPPTRPSSLRRWVDSLPEAAMAVETGDWASIAASPGVHLHSASRRPGKEKVTVQLGQDETSSLLEGLSVRRDGPDELVLASVATAISDRAEDGRVRFMVEGHGRMTHDNSLDLTDVVGWLTSLTPVIVDVPDSSSPSGSLPSARRALRAVIASGHEYGTARYFHPDPGVRRSLAVDPSSTILFNYLGRLEESHDRRSRFTVESPLELSTPEGTPPTYGLEVNSWIAEGTLVIELSYPDGAMSSRDARRLAELTLDHLRTLIERPSGGEAEVRSAAEFPNANLDDEGLSKLAALLSNEGDH